MYQVSNCQRYNDVCQMYLEIDQSLQNVNYFIFVHDRFFFVFALYTVSRNKRTPVVCRFVSQSRVKRNPYQVKSYRKRKDVGLMQRFCISLVYYRIFRSFYGVRTLTQSHIQRPEVSKYQCTRAAPQMTKCWV